MKRVEIEHGSGWEVYRQDAPVPPGPYFVTNLRKPKGTDKESQAKWLKLKQSLCLIPATGPGCRFAWLAPAERWARELLCGGRVIFDPTTVKSVEPDWEMIGFDPKKLRGWQRGFITEAWTTLAYKRQYRKGWIVSLGGGKTLAGLLLCQLFDRPAVLADRYLHATWKSEAEKWGFNVPLLSTYESCHKLPEDVDCLVVDEILRLKNPNARRSVNARAVGMKCEAVVGFTAIATAGRGPLDFGWLRVVEPECLPAPENAFRFLFGAEVVLKEVAPGVKAYVVEEWDNQKILDFVDPYLTTVDTSELLSDLPEIEHRYIDCPNPSQWDTIALGGATSRGTMKKLAQCRQCTDGFVLDDNENPIRLNDPRSKVDMVVDYIESLGEPVLVYSAWREGVALLRERLSSYNPAVVEGGSEDPGAQVERFRSGETDVLIANSRYSRGMNLQERCRIILFLSVSSIPDDYEQALGRVYRPGQKRGCIAVYFCCENTLDRRTIELVQKHKGMSEKFIDGLLAQELEELTEDME